MSELKQRHEGNVMFTIGLFFYFSNMFERFAYYGLTGQNSYIYTAIFRMNGNTAGKIHSVFSTLAFCTPLAGAILADRYIGRFKTIMVSYPPYFAGVALCVLSQLLAVTVWDEPSGGQSTALTVFYTVGIMAGIAVGTGLLRNNLVVLGADQFDDKDEYQAKQQSLHFSAFYFSTNLAAFIGFFFMSTLAINGVGKLKGYKNKSMRVFVVTLLSAFFIVCSIIPVIFMRTSVITKPAKGSVLIDFVGAVRESWTVNVYSIMVVLGTIGYCVGILVAFLGYFISSQDEGATNYLSAILIVVSCIFYLLAGSNSEWIENSSTENGGSYDPELISGFKAILILNQFIPFAVVFWLIYNSMYTFFLMQGCVMKTQVVSWYNMPSSQLSSWNSLIIVAFVPLHEKYIYPGITKMGFEMTLLRKQGYGLIWAVITMLLAGGIELARKRAPLIPVQSSCYDVNDGLVFERDFNVLIQISVYGAVSMAEIGFAIANMEFFYSQVPTEVRSVVQALSLVVVGLGTAAGGVILTAFEFWTPNNLDMGNIEYVYLFIAVLGILNIIVFTFYAFKYDYQNYSNSFELGNSNSDGVSIDDNDSTKK